jgi:hypothetical protein
MSGDAIQIVIAVTAEGNNLSKIGHIVDEIKISLS